MIPMTDTADKTIYRGGLTKAEWDKAVKFDSIDWGWTVMSVGMAIGSGIVFLPIQIGVTGILIFLLSSIIGYPVMYAFQRLYINTLAAAPENRVYSETITGYLGKNWGFLLGAVYFLMLMNALISYATTVTRDSASFLYSFGVTSQPLMDSALYALVLMVILVVIASCGEKVLFKLQTVMSITILATLVFMGLSMIPSWSVSNIAPLPDLATTIKQTIIMLPFTMTSILFIQSLSPMVISYRTHFTNKEVAWHKAMRTMNISFIVLFVIVFFYALSFNLGTSQEMALAAKEQNISALAMVAGDSGGALLKLFSIILALFAILTSFFSSFLGFVESCKGIALNVLHRVMDDSKINQKALRYGIIVFSILFCWLVITLNIPVLMMLSFLGPMIGIIGCFVPVILVYKVDYLHRFKSPVLWAIVLTGILLTVSPFLNVLQ